MGNGKRMFRKATLIIGIFATCSLLWFTVYNYRQAGPIAQENLRGLALTLTSAIENLAVNDPSFAGLAKFRTNDIAYFALVDSQGRFRFHSNPDLIGASLPEAERKAAPKLERSESRVALGTGEQAFLVITPINLNGEILSLHLTLHTYRADAVVRSAKLNLTAMLALIATGWLLSLGLFRYARREELHQAEMTRKVNLAKLGEMGALLAHEIRNPLAGIKGFAQVVAKKPQEARNAAFAQNIVTEVVRLETLVNDLLAYAAGDGAQRAPFDLDELIDNTLSLLAPEAVEREVSVCCSSTCSFFVMGNRDRMEQTLLNLGKNALQAMDAGGVLEIACASAGGQAQISIKDTGQGIAEADLPKVFEPFFTTRARGTGLGLALCKKVIEEHDGTIVLESRIGEGTKVTLALPLLPADKEQT